MHRDETVDALKGLVERGPFPRVGAAVFVMKDSGHILIGRSSGEPTAGKWVIPGGVVKPFESIKQAAERKILEKAGIAIESKQVLFLSEKVAPPDEHRIVVYCYGEYLSGDLKAGGDLSEVLWVDPRDLGNYQGEMSGMTVDAFVKLNAWAAAGQG